MCRWKGRSNALHASERARMQSVFSEIEGFRVYGTPMLALSMRPHTHAAQDSPKYIGGLACGYAKALYVKRYWVTLPRSSCMCCSPSACTCQPAVVATGILCKARRLVAHIPDVMREGNVSWCKGHTPEEGDGDAAEDDGAPDARAVLGVAGRAHAEHRPPHVLLRLLCTGRPLPSITLEIPSNAQYPCSLPLQLWLWLLSSPADMSLAPMTPSPCRANQPCPVRSADEAAAARAGVLRCFSWLFMGTPCAA